MLSYILFAYGIFGFGFSILDARKRIRQNIKSKPSMQELQPQSENPAITNT